MSNISLIGMMGCGKSTVGKLLARQLGYQFFDTDKIVENKVGCKISDIFDRFGEAEFRKIEAQVIADLAQNNNSVISMGGGAILNENNMNNAKKYGIIVFINRPPTHILSDLRTSNRPLLRNDNFMEIYKKRLVLYKKYADIEISNTGTPMHAIKKIVTALA